MNQKFDSIDERYSIRHLTGQVRSVIVQRTFYTLHIRYMFVFPLYIRYSYDKVRKLIVLCPLTMRYSCVLCAHYTFREDFIATETTFITGAHQINIFFCIFLSVRRPLPLSGNM